MQATTRTEQDHYGAFAEWFGSPVGQALLACERRVVRRRLELVFGARQLEVGIDHSLALADTHNCAHCMRSQVHGGDTLPPGTLVCLPEELPFGNESLDLVILHHTLDISVQPHQALREASRVLKGGGRLLVVGFNPLSLWGAWRLCSRRQRVPWSGRFMAWSRVEDWLRLLAFELESLESYFFRPPLQHQATLTRLQGLDALGGVRMIPTGAFYMALAEKRVPARIPLRPVWSSSSRRIVGLPAARQRPASHAKTDGSVL
ncbi:MAG: methyltransferase domain-containing protein [Gammaproteobacteria bacterium]|nr:methyltransferase domain-containing protein [Gammaproteobacteria bacterium]